MHTVMAPRKVRSFAREVGFYPTFDVLLLLTSLLIRHAMGGRLLYQLL